MILDDFGIFVGYTIILVIITIIINLSDFYRAFCDLNMLKCAFMS